MSDDQLPPPPVYTSPHGQNEPPRRVLIEELCKAARAAGEGRYASASARLAAARRALENAWQGQVDALRHDFATASLAEQRLRLYLEPWSREVTVARNARARDLPAVVEGAELAATVCEARAKVAERQGRMEEAALARDLARVIRAVADPVWPPPAVENERPTDQVSRLRDVLARSAASNHLARHPGASAANWEHCEQPSCRDARAALGLGSPYVLLGGGGAMAESERELAKGVGSAVTTRIEAFGELIWEPGMSDDESATRDRDVSWRHGGEADAVEVAEMHVAAGRWTAERAAEHLRGLREQAARDRVRVEELDRKRQKG